VAISWQRLKITLMLDEILATVFGVDLILVEDINGQESLQLRSSSQRLAMS